MFYICFSLDWWRGCAQRGWELHEPASRKCRRTLSIHYSVSMRDYYVNEGEMKQRWTFRLGWASNIKTLSIFVDVSINVFFSHLSRHCHQSDHLWRQICSPPYRAGARNGDQAHPKSHRTLPLRRRGPDRPNWSGRELDRTGFSTTSTDTEIARNFFFWIFLWTNSSIFFLLCEPPSENDLCKIEWCQKGGIQNSIFSTYKLLKISRSRTLLKLDEMVGRFFA